MNKTEHGYEKTLVNCYPVLMWLYMK